MKACRFWLVLVLLEEVLAAMASDGVVVKYSASGASHYRGETKSVYGFGGDDFQVLLRGTNNCDTAWYVASDKVIVPDGCSGYAFDFEIYADADWRRAELSDGWCCRLVWYGADGRRIRAERWVDTLGVSHEPERFSLSFTPGVYAAFRLVGEVPVDAKAVTIGFGADQPNILPGEKVAVRNTRFTAIPKGEPLPNAVSPDFSGPVVTSVFVSPSEDPALAVVFAVSDSSGVDWNSIKVSVVGHRTLIPFVREDNRIVLKPEGGVWTEGDHHVVVSLADILGNKTVVCKAFRIGVQPEVPMCSLRKDGVTLVDGKPFFPIGMFAVCPREANLYSLERAFQDLSAAGVNLVHSYSDARNPEFLAGCEKYGLKTFIGEYSAAEGSKWFEETGRQSPAVLSWYTGDDTSRLTTPEVFANRGEALNALDGHRLISHADGYGSNYRLYVTGADVFMPEIYPIRGDESEDAKCVALVIDQVEKACADNRLASPDRSRAVWPLIQCFKGYTAWKRMPTPQEFYAMSFAGLIHGGKGIVFYTYGGFVQPEKKKFNYGVTSSAETWNATTNLTRRLSSLASVLVAEDVLQPPAPIVLEGPVKDAFGRGAITMLLKKTPDGVYVLAVNATKQRVKARFTTGSTATMADVLWEDRAVVLTDGFFYDVFDPFAVHVYMLADGCRKRHD